MKEKADENDVEQQKEVSDKDIEAESSYSVRFELPKSIKAVIELQNKISQVATEDWILEQVRSMERVIGPFRETMRNAEEYLAQPHIIDAVSRAQRTLNLVNDVTKEDKWLKKLSENPRFWRNLSNASRELIIFYTGTSNEVIDYLNSDSFHVEELKRLMGKFDVMLLEEELEDEEHLDYRFKSYLQEILELHKTNPGNYRVSIPALFAILEGTLGEIFKISEDGMAQEIKQKMNIYWDIHDFVFANQALGRAFTFWNQFYLTNAKNVFIQLTVNSKEAGFRINRNAVLHGKSSPTDWTIEDFETLLNLLHTTIYLRKTMDFLRYDFDGMMHDDFYDGERLIWKEVEQGIPIKKKNGDTRTYKSKEIRNLRKELKQDLKDIFGYEEEKLEFIFERSNFHEIEERLLAIKP